MPLTSSHYGGAPHIPMPPSLLTGCTPVIADRREGSRSATLFTIGKLTCNSRSLPCMARDLSDGGIRIQMTVPPARGDSCGFRFVEPISSVALTLALYASALR